MCLITGRVTLFQKAMPRPGRGSAQSRGGAGDCRTRQLRQRSRSDAAPFPHYRPWQQVLSERTRLFLTHGHLYSPDNLPPLAAGDVLAYGHTHIPVAEKRGEIFLFNPGSVSIPKGGFTASYGLLNEGQLQVLALDDNQVIAEVAIYP